MKKLYTVLLAIFILSGMMFAQKLAKVPSTGRAPNAGDVKISPEPLNANLVPSTHSFAVKIYPTPTGLVSFWLDVPTTFNNIGTTTRSIFAGDFNGSGVLYALDYDSNELVTVDTSTGVFTLVAACLPGAGESWTGMSWDKTTNTMYATAFGTSSNLYTLNLTTGIATLVGTIGSYIVIDIAINNAGQIYGHEISTDNIITINKTTGAGTILGSTTISCNYAQGMSFHPVTDELYLAAYTASSTSGLYQVNLTTGAATLIGGFPSNCEVDAFTIPGGFGPPCPVGAPSNPSPADLTVNLPLTGIQLSWTNPANATTNEVYFGTSPATMVLVSSGTLATSYSIPGSLNYFQSYYWRVVEKNDTCGVSGPVWTFKTMQDPDLFFAFQDDFTAGAGNWTITNDGGTELCKWTVFPTPWPNTYTLPPTAEGSVFAADADNGGSGSSSLTTATLTTPLDFSGYQHVELQFDNDWQAIDADDSAFVEVSNDNGATWVRYITWGSEDVRNTHEVIDISATAALHNNVIVRFKTIQPGWDWWWAIDNVKIIGGDVVPVELSSFKADVSGDLVTLNWVTSSETNNNGFYVERKSGTKPYQEITFIKGNGTSTEVNNYSFVDKTTTGNFTYRLRQVDFDGTSNYSNEVEVNVELPKTFSLAQNYPNPFNPATVIKFSVPVQSEVKLSVYNIMGELVKTLVNEVKAEGYYEVTFDASSLSSGIYFYNIEARSGNGETFSSIKKMSFIK